MLDKPGGFKRRRSAEAKLEFNNSMTGPQSVGFIIANSDGTFTPAIWLLGNDLALARSFAERGIHVIGG
jgi:hypothetical protein